MAFNEELGDHLRRLRKQKGLSLLDVEADSDKEFKASVLGAYERGERAISAARLARLARLYGLPLQAMLPSRNGDAPRPVEGGLALDLARLDGAESPDAQLILRFGRNIQRQRGVWTERVLAIRSADVAALAAALDTTPDGLVRRLEELGARAHRSRPASGERMEAE